MCCSKLYGIGHIHPSPVSCWWLNGHDLDYGWLRWIHPMMQHLHHYDHLPSWGRPLSRPPCFGMEKRALNSKHVCLLALLPQPLSFDIGKSSWYSFLFFAFFRSNNTDWYKRIQYRAKGDTQPYHTLSIFLLLVIPYTSPASPHRIIALSPHHFFPAPIPPPFPWTLKDRHPWKRPTCSSINKLRNHLMPQWVRKMLCNDA